MYTPENWPHNYQVPNWSSTDVSECTYRVNPAEIGYTQDNWKTGKLYKPLTYKGRRRILYKNKYLAFSLIKLKPHPLDSANVNITAWFVTFKHWNIVKQLRIETAILQEMLEKCDIKWVPSAHQLVDSLTKTDVPFRKVLNLMNGIMKTDVLSKIHFLFVTILYFL